MRSNLKFLGTILFALVFLMGGVLVTKSAQAADLTVVSNSTNASYYDAVVKGADHLLSQQNPDGGWSWYGASGTASDVNLTGVNAIGLLNAYQLTNNQAYLNGAKLAGDKLKAINTVAQIDETGHKFYSSDIEFLAKLALVTDDTTYSVKASQVMTHFITEANRYCDTGCASAQIIADKYHGWDPAPSGIAEWQIAGWVEAAKLTGQTEWGTALANILKADVLDEAYGASIKLTQNKYYALGLASALEETALFSIDNADIKTKLLAEQDVNTGAITANSEDGVNQTTAYSIMGLSAAGDTSHATASVNFLTGLNKQNSNGGWTESDGKEYTENNSEIIQAIYSVLPSNTYYTIQDAVNAAVDGDTINVGAGEYTENGQIVINKNLSIIGADKATTIIKPYQNTGSDADSRGWFLVNSGKTFNLSNVTLNGENKLINIGILSHGNGTIENNILKNIGDNPSTSYAGRGIAFYDSNMTISNNTLSNIGRIGIYMYGTGVTNAQITGNTYTGKGAGNWLDYGIEVEGGAIAFINGNTVRDNLGVAKDDSTSAGIYATTYFAPGTTATITDNTLTHNTDGIAVGYDETDASIVVAYDNKFSGNTHAINSTHPSVNAINNYWGNASGPASDTIIGNVSFDPWYTNATMTVLSNSQAEQYASETTTTLDSDTTSVVLDTGSSSVKEIIVPDTIPSTQEITLDMSSLLVDSSDSVTLGSNDMTLERQGTNNYSALLPSGTVITGDSNWNGNLILPTITTLTSSSGTVNVAVEMGSTQRLNFSNAVKVVLGGMAGKNALYSDGTGEHTISACTDASDTTAGSLATGGECSISVGSDLIIWTYHFTTFAAYTPTPSQSHGSGGSYIQPVTPAVPAKITTPDGCAAGNKFSTTTGRNCNAATPAVPAGQVLGASTQVGQVLGAEKFNFTILVKNGSKGNEIVELQKLLTSLGYDLGIADGKFGAKTKRAVIKLQIANGLKGDGVVGAKTRAILNK